jgi:hypothetical protein
MLKCSPPESDKKTGNHFDVNKSGCFCVFRHDARGGVRGGHAMPRDALDACLQLDGGLRREVREGLRLVYKVEGKAVLTFRQRDCVVQYVCEVRAPSSSHMGIAALALRDSIGAERSHNAPSVPYSQVCDDYRLSHQTAWAAMYYFDRYLCHRGTRAIDRKEAELISLTCILIAAKFFENQSPVRPKPQRLPTRLLPA